MEKGKPGREVKTCSEANRASTFERPNLETVLKDSSADDSGSPRFVRSSETTLSSIRSLKAEEFLVLFTPVVPPPPASRPMPHDTDNAPPMDPFEPLGRALSRHHARVRHVPYVPAIGMTNTHVAFLRHAGAVVAVVCHDSNLLVQGEERENHSSYAAQTEFAREVLERKLFPASKEGPPEPEKPVLLILVTSDPERSTEFGAGFEVVLHITVYTPSALEKVADLVFGV